jgi:hypothetical protein
VFELDSDALHLESPNGAWPGELPRIDGVLICYDVSDPASFARVPDLLGMFSQVVSIAVALISRSLLPCPALARCSHGLQV